MRRILAFTACALGISLSVAAAQEWTREELERGIQRTQQTRHVPSGAKRTLENLGMLDPDCTMPEGYEVKLTSPPKHGAVEIVEVQAFSSYVKENIRSRCNDRRTPSFNLNYKSADGFRGQDGFDVTIYLPSGHVREIHYNIDVR
jgi:hypothetical protein